MNTPQPSNGADPRRPDEELFAWRLAAGAGETKVPTDATPEERARLALLAGDLERIRAALEPAADPLSDVAQVRSARAVAQRVLERTTREDPSLLGDARLVLRFCRQRLSSSMVLRLAAASLLLHLAAAPVLAYYALRRAEPPQTTILRFEPPSAAPYGEGPIEVVRPVRFLAPGEDPPAPLSFPAER